MDRVFVEGITRAPMNITVDIIIIGIIILGITMYMYFRDDKDE